MEQKAVINLAFESVEPEDFDIIDGGKPPIIFLHGMTFDRSTWKKVIGPIVAATGRKAYAFDARNHGDSGWSQEMSYKIMVKDLLDFMDALPAQKAILIGHSMGGKTAYFFAVAEPERLEKLIVEDMAPKPNTPEMKAAFLSYMRLMQFAVGKIPPKVKSLKEAKKFVNAILHPRSNDQNREQSMGDGGTDGSNLPLYRASGKFKWKTNFKAVADSLPAPGTEIEGLCTSPTFIIYGTESPYRVGDHLDFIRGVFPNCQFRAVEGANHQIHLEHEDIFVKEVTEFINAS